MYRSAVLTVFLAALAIVAVDLAVRIFHRRPHQETNHQGQGPMRYLRIAVNLAGLFGLLAVAYTGFTALLDDNQMTGDRLIWHVTFAPVFALTAVAVTIFWAHRNRFEGADAGRLTSAGGWGVPLRKFFFWCAVAMAVPTLLSILAAMFPIFGTEDQQELFRIHRYCAPLLASAGLLFAYFALVTWRQRSSD
jgi:hypothetical protein